MPQIDISIIHQASRVPVVRALSGFVGKPVEEWLPTSHPYSNGQLLNARKKPFRRFDKFIRGVQKHQVHEVLAATGPSHCLDGWTFFSRALVALLSGDAHTGRHLAYYAQLRAALSILHSHGVGIFNGINFTVDEIGEIHRIDTNPISKSGLRTHDAVWEVLSVWAEWTDTARVFLEEIEFRGISLQTCIDTVWPSAQTTPLVSKIIDEWGVDLNRWRDERNSRNLSSYAPQAFNVIESKLATRLNLILAVWHALEPDGSGGYPTLDRHLLRKLLELMDDAQAAATGHRVQWNSDYVKLDPVIQTFVDRDFLTRTSEERVDHPILIHANKKKLGDVHAMVSRALLLLRAATAIVRSSFVDAQFDVQSNDLQPYFDSVGIDRGFWTANDPPNHYAELWDVVSYAVSDIKDYSLNNLGDQLHFLETFGPDSVILSQAERACIWGISV